MFAGSDTSTMRATPPSETSFTRAATSSVRRFTTRSAPARRASAACSSRLTVAATFAPAHFASMIAASPTAPAPPCTSTHSPAIGPSANSARCAVNAGMPRHAPTSNDTPSGNGTACCAGNTVYSAAVPPARPRCASYTQTRSPTRAGSTPAPTRSITPAPSWCGTIRGNAIGCDGPPPRPLVSEGFTALACTRTRTCPGAGCGSGSSPTCSTSAAAPCRS